jgi:drug/metabolite transporter (DMT)-like permease
MTWKLAVPTAFSGLLAMGVGMTLLLFALSGGQAGVISTLSATSPVMILPMLWLLTGERPATGAWAGAGLVVAGMALIFMGR